MTTFAEVQPTPAAPPTRSSGLVATVGVTTESDTRWVNGFTWRPETCFQGQTLPQCGSGLGTATGPTDGGLAYHLPTGLRVDFVCANRYGLNAAEENARTVRQLEAASSYLLARELWLGTATQAHNYVTPQTSPAVNGYLTDGNAQVIAGEFEPLEALGLLEETARAALLGQFVHLHVPIVLLPTLGPSLTVLNGTLYTPSGSKVIADPGYDGSGPAAAAATPATVWMFATAPVQVRLGQAYSYTVPTVANNTRLFVAERPAAASYDPCGHFGIAVALPGDVTPG